MKIYENLGKIEEIWKFAKNQRFPLKIWSKLKIFENLVNNENFRNLIKLEDYSNFGHNQRYLKIR